MRLIHRPTFRVFLIAAVAAAVSLVIVLYSVRGGAWADPPTCANVECNSVCWSDGTHPNNGTEVIHKSFTDLNCGNNDGTCITQPCGHGGGH